MKYIDLGFDVSVGYYNSKDTPVTPSVIPFYLQPRSC